MQGRRLAAGAGIIAPRPSGRLRLLAPERIAWISPGRRRYLPPSPASQRGTIAAAAPAAAFATAGREGTGKSSSAIWLTAQVTRGTLPGRLTRRGVLYVAVEDSWKHAIVRRLIACRRRQPSASQSIRACRPGPAEVSMISGTKQRGEVRSRNRTASATSEASSI